MLFNSFHFALFFPVVFLLYYKIPHEKRWMFLLGASYYFYMSYRLDFIILIILSTTIDYFCAISMEDKPVKKKTYLWISLCSNLGCLFLFKYFNFFNNVLGDVLRAISIPFSPSTLNLLLPIGISFYTFQTLSYSIDVYRGTIKAERHFGYFALFVSFFPQLVAGPIERADRLLPQMREKHEFDYDNVSYGMKLMAIGFFKKLCVADYFGSFVDIVYYDVYGHTGLALVIVALLFSIQIYCDFSGYSDIARGCAKMLGFQLMANFKSPYLATNIQDFWRRWHISLSFWFKDYVYIPLGGRDNLTRNTLIVFTLSGLWHGASYNFLFWGLLNGLYISVYRAVSKKIKNSRKNQQPSPEKNMLIGLCGTGVTFIIVSVSRVFSRSTDLSEAFYIITHFFHGITDIKSYIFNGYAPLGISANVLFSIILRFLILLLIDSVNVKHDIIEVVSKQKTSTRYFIYVAFIVLTTLLAPKNSAAEFIYFQF